MSTQPKALRLADLLEHQVYRGSYKWERVETLMLDAAYELRRLHGANMDCIAWFDALKSDYDAQQALLRQALEALELRCGTNADERKEFIPALRERLGENT